MELKWIAGDCGEEDCPTVFTTDRGTLAIQGYVVDRRTPEGEAIVEIPMELLKEAFRAIDR